MINSFERDQPRSDASIRDISITSEAMINTAKKLFNELEVDKEKMRKNLDLTKGLILSQRVTFFLADKIGKDTADNLMHDVSMKALNEDITLRQAIKKSDEISMYFSDKDLDILLNPETYIGLAIEQTKLVIQDIESKR